MTQIERQQGVWAGPMREPVNRSRSVAGSIHDDATASKLGFRGGTVAGSIHMEMFPPLLIEAFGPRWFEQGTLSLYFVNATTDREAVRAFLREPPPGARDAQIDVWIERDDGMRVAEGTASVGAPAEKTALQARELERFAPGELRMLGDLAPGDPLGTYEVCVTRETQDARRALITEPLDWYWGDSPWGGSVLTPATAVGMLYREAIAGLRHRTGGAVGLFGAIELRNVHGPLQIDTPYRLTGQVLATGQSPKTEYLWFETGADDAEGRRVAEMRMLLRFMKASSAHYRDA